MAYGSKTEPNQSRETHGVGGLDSRAIGDGIGKGHAELNDVGAAFLHGKENVGGGLGRRVAGSDIGDERSLQWYLGQ